MHFDCLHVFFPFREYQLAAVQYVQFHTSKILVERDEFLLKYSKVSFPPNFYFIFDFIKKIEFFLIFSSVKNY